jgi:hypothetical protein
MSELFPHLNEVADELTMIRSMVAETANHIPGIFQANTRFLQAQHLGVPFNTKRGPPILDLQRVIGIYEDTQRERLDLLNRLNADHLKERVQTNLLAARIHSHELAARMQNAIPEAMDFSSEPKHVQTLYGLDRAECRDTARNCLAARRLIERGVRTVQLWTGDGVSSDAHGDITGSSFKPGFAFGATDEIGYTAVENPVTTYDLHATVLDLLGIDHSRLTFYYNGIQRRLTNVHGHVVQEIQR